MKRAGLEPMLAATVALTAWLTVLSPAPAAIRTPAAVALLGILPGYALLKALGLDRSTGVVEEALLAVGGSLSLVVVLSVGIGISVAQLRGPVVATVLTGVILGMLVLRWIVDWRTPSEDASLPDAAARWIPSSLRIHRSATGWGIGTALAIGALAIAAVSSQSTRADVVQFWATQAPGGATVGIRNDAPTASTYRLAIGPTGAEEESRDVTVTGGQQWQVYLAFPTSWPRGATVVASLYTTGDPTPFRVVRLAPRPSSSP
jgi:xanthosine utilization system XapX-like protein